MNEIKIFENSEFGKLDVLLIDGKVHFRATECAKILGYTNPHKAVNDHCRALTKREVIDSMGRTQEMNMIPEGDLYRLIIRCKLPAAEKFERWVFDEVIPSIRRTGGYIAGQEQMSDLELLSKALLVAQRQIEERNAQIEKMKPKAIFADAVSGSQDSILIGDYAKILAQNGVNIGANRLFAWLRENSYLIRRYGESWNMPTQRSMELGLFEVVERTVHYPDGSVHLTRTAKLTGKGQVYFFNRLKLQL